MGTIQETPFRPLDTQARAKGSAAISNTSKMDSYSNGKGLRIATPVIRHSLYDGSEGIDGGSPFRS